MENIHINVICIADGKTLNIRMKNAKIVYIIDGQVNLNGMIIELITIYLIHVTTYGENKTI